MAFIFRPSTFNMLKPLLQQRSFNTFEPMVAASTMAKGADFKQSIRNQTRVSTTLATHLLSKEPNSNVVFSPLSIHVVLSLLAAGSKGQTLDQLLAFLKTNTTHDLNSLYSRLVSSILADASPNGGPRLHFANGFWVDKTFTLNPSFKQLADTVYNKAACKQVDFAKADEVAKEVDLWAAKQTNGLIKGVLPANVVSSRTGLLFANAVYFKGAWSKKFDESMTEKFDFHHLNGNKVRVPFMTSKEKQFVCEFSDFKVLGLRYLQGKGDHKFTMYFYLPDAKDGLPSLIQKIGITPDFLDNHIPYTAVPVGKFLIPKFKIAFEFEASNMLKELGIVLPFRYGDDLTEIGNSSTGESPFVSGIHHKSFVEVNEEGTEVAAVTRAGFRTCDRPSYKKVDFVADHPFLYVIREDVTGVVLFMGQVV
uniref:Putative serpin-Z7 n=2 Tax=Helianthus annuus TaxID=4232 RepID=A0A251SVC7_HELAN